MQSRDNYLGRSTAPGFRVLAQPSRSPTPLQQGRSDTVLPPIILSRCVTKSTHAPFARRSRDGLDHSIPIERLAEGLLQIAVSRTPRPEHSPSPSKFTAPGRSRYSAKDFAPAIAWTDCGPSPKRQIQSTRRRFHGPNRVGSPVWPAGATYFGTTSVYRTIQGVGCLSTIESQRADYDLRGFICWASLKLIAGNPGAWN
jgi:hypothetical protein